MKNTEFDAHSFGAESFGTPIFGKKLSRRTLLKGAGAALALPWLPAMVPALCANERLKQPPLRSAFLFMPNGVRPEKFTPEGDGEDFAMTPMLKSLTGVKDQILLLENLWHKNTLGRNGHWPKVPAFLSGGFVVRTAGRDLDTGCMSVDQLLAEEIGNHTPLPSLELAVDHAYSGVDNIGGGFAMIYGSHIAWKDRYTPIVNEIVPQLAFDRLFRTGPRAPVVSGITPKQKAVADSLAGDQQSVLDAVLDDAKRLRGDLSGEDRAKVDEYLESVRSVEKRLQQSLKPQKRWINQGRFDVPRPGPGIPKDHREHVRLMLDIIMLAFWTDSTRVATFMFGNAQTGRQFPFLDGVKGSFHGISHHQNKADKLKQYQAIGTWHVEQVAYLLQRMQEQREGDGTLLDHSQILFGSSLKEGNSHNSHDLPIILAGGANGKLKTGRRLRYKEDTPLCNLYLNLLENAGVNRKAFGDSNGMLDRLV